jgi:signal transduction histidine kinase/CheY-like chemotaxis protein
MSRPNSRPNVIDEASRLKVLESYNILDTPAEQGFDDIVLLASQVCGTPVALVSFVASDRQWFKARVGFDPSHTPLSQSVCALAIQQPGLFIIPDLSADPRTQQNPLVSGDPNIRFYAGARLETANGDALGSLCVIDTKPRSKGLGPGQAAALEALARQVMTLMELRIAHTEQSVELAHAQAALRQSQKMEAIGQLTGGIAHDFNNLLTGIIGSIDIIRRRLAASRLDDIPPFLDAASSAAHRAAALTNRLLAFARRQSLDATSTDVNTLVVGMEDMLRRTLGKEVGLQVARANGLWPAMLDANQLESAVLNLAINARDAMPDGGQLTIETANTHLDENYARQHDELSAGDYVVVSVSDTGTGMSPDVIAQAFEPFFTTKPTGAGTGLGLSMIYGFIKQSHGHVHIYSEVGSGTTVRLYLPRALTDMGKLPAVEMHSTPQGEGEIVLVVEDDAAVRLLIRSALEELGYQYMDAPDATSALAILQTRVTVDLLITDVGLPVMNGRQLAEIAQLSRPDLKVLFVTGYAEAATVRGGFLADGMDMLTKPFALDTLGSKVREIIER